MKSDMLRAFKLGIALLSMDSGIIANTSACQHVERGCHRMCVICFCPNHPCWCSQVPSQYPLTVKRISGHRAVQWLKSQEKPRETSGLPLFAFCPPPARIAVHNTRKWRGSSLANPLLCQNGKGHKASPMTICPTRQLTGTWPDLVGTATRKATVTHCCKPARRSCERVSCPTARSQ